MSAHRKHRQSPEANAAMRKFLDACDNRTYPEDVGAILGQMSLLRERATFDHPDPRIWRKAVSLAVTAH